MADEVTLHVPAKLDGERVDKALAVLFGISRSEARRLIDTGVLADGLAVKPGDRVAPGTVLVSPAPGDEPALEPEPLDFDVVYEDDEVIVVDKPPGVVVHPGSGRTRGTLAAGLLYRYPELEGVGQAGRWGLVHRLDKDTSGALIVARSPGSYEALTGMLRRREIKRVYVSLVHGLFTAPTGSIDAPIGRDPARPTRRALARDGKRALTHYEVTRAYADQGVSLLRVTLETGRTHQIRVHLAGIDHPVVGDRVYGTKLTSVDAPRVFLHAVEVGFRHPTTGLDVGAACPLPDDLGSILAGLEAGSSG